MKPKRVDSAVRHTSLGELALLFTRLGATSFGGPAVHIAMMRDEAVTRRGWLTDEEFLDLLGATNLIPGPNSTEMAIHVGHKVAGWRGRLVAGASFIMPATAIVGALAWVYVGFGALPEVQALLYGVTPVVIAIIAHALWGLARTAVKSLSLAILALVGIAAAAGGTNQLVVLAAGGAAAGLLHAISQRPERVKPDIRVTGLSIAGAAKGLTPAAAATAAAASSISLGTLFFVFLKAGAVLFGSGYVLIAFLRADLVERLKWLTEAQLLNAIAIGQVTPGPVSTTATFIGYVLAGPVGALVATIGIFVPAFVYVAVSAPVVPRLRRSALAGAVLDGVNVASMALMALVTWQMGRSVLVDPTRIGMALASAALLLWARLNSAWLILIGATVGIVTTL